MIVNKKNIIQNSSKIRVALLCPQLINNHPAGEMTLVLVKELCDQVEFTIYGSKIDQELKNSGKIKFIKLPIPILKPRIFTYIIQFFIYWFVFYWYKLKRFDVIHSVEAVAPLTNIMSMHFCGPAASNLRKRGIISYKGWRKYYYSMLDSIGCYFEFKICHNKYIKDLIVVSDGLKNEVIKYNNPKAKISVIPNYVDKINPSISRKDFRKSFEIKENDRVGLIVALGDWERKGLPFIIDAYNKMSDPYLKLFVVGSGPIEKYKKTVNKNINENILFVGFRKDIDNFYAASDFFIFPSAYESWSIVGFKAAISGLCLITTKVNGIGDIVQHHKNGLIIERHSSSIYDSLEYINSNNFRILGEKIQPLAEKYTKSNMIESYLKLYETYQTLK